MPPDTTSAPDYISLSSPGGEIPGLGFISQKPNGQGSPSDPTNRLTSNMPQTNAAFTQSSWERLLEESLAKPIAPKQPVAKPVSTSISSDHVMEDAPADNGATETNGTDRAVKPVETNRDEPPDVGLAAAGAANDDPPLLDTIPQFMVFGPSEDELEYLIPRKSLQTMPGPALSRLAAKGLIEGTSITMKNYDQVESMRRLKGYLDSKKYIPFKPRVPLEHVLPGGNTASWEPPSNKQDQLTAHNVTKTTEELFSHEIDLYLFAMEIGYNELRQESCRNLMTSYPQSVNGIWMQIERLYPKSHPADQILRDHLLALIDANRRQLMAAPSYVNYMMQFVETKGPLGKALLDAYIRAANEARLRVTELLNKERVRVKTPATPSEKITDPKEVGHIIRKDSTSKLSHGSSPPHTPVEERWPAEMLRPSDLPRLARSLNDNRILVANRDGWGTLVRTSARNERNKDFQFSAGELLLGNPYESAQTGHNIVVYNSKGEKGDILRDLVSWAAPELGIPANFREWSQLHDLPLIPSGQRHASLPDREERLYRNERRRSRSPPSVRH